MDISSLGETTIYEVLRRGNKENDLLNYFCLGLISRALEKPSSTKMNPSDTSSNMYQDKKKSYNICSSWVRHTIIIINL